MYSSIFHRSKLLLFHKITSHSILLSHFSFSTLITDIVQKSPTINNSKIKNPSFIVSYLIDSCGLSPETAKTISISLKFDNPKRPDSVLELLKNYGFDQTHVSRLVRACPRIITFDPEKTLLPKLKYLHSIGFSKADLATILSYSPNMLSRSLENQIIPICRLLRELLGSDKKVVSFIKRTRLDVSIKYLVPNVNALRELPVPASNIVLLANFPTIMLQKHDQFMEAVDKVKVMGFDPLKCTFVLAIRVLSGKSNKLMWDRCSETYKKWGWSEDDILSAFKKHPLCMTVSAKKIDKAMDFFVNQMGYQSKEIAEMPSILLFSLEKRIIPRCAVIQVLTSKGLIKKVNFYSILLPVEEKFVSRFVTRYEEQSPELMRVYRGEVEAL